VTYRFGSSTYIINCERGGKKSAKIAVNLVDDGKVHEIKIVI
jgi:RNase P/RNase MRP subunit POP5